MAVATNRFSRKPTQGHDENARQSNRRSGWIIAASIGGLILSIPVLLLVAGFIRGITSAHRSVAQHATFDPQYEAAAESYLQNLGMEKFTSKEFGFSVMMPKDRSTANADFGRIFIGPINGHSITVIAKDLPPSDPLYNVESVVAMRSQLIIGMSRNKEVSDVQSPRNIKDKNGHVGTELMYTLAYGGTRIHEQSHAFQVGHRMCVVQIAAPEAQWDKQLADSVLATFSMQ